MMEKKTAVYCRTIEEYNIVAKHYNRTAKEYFTERGSNCIKPDCPDSSHPLGCDYRYTDIPFNEWILTEMPRVGDKVIIIKSDLDWVALMDRYVGKIVTVTSTKETYIQFYDGCWTWDFSKGHFRIATPEEISNQDFINDTTKIPYKLIPKFSKGDKVKICSSEEDIYNDGFMQPDGKTEPIMDVAGDIKTLTGEIKEINGNIYYGYEEFRDWIKESCLSLIKYKITEYKGYKVGDAIIVKNKPANWSSALNENDPRDEKYPIVGVIKCIEYNKEHHSPYYAMDMGGYGWSLSHLIDTNNISKIENLTEYAGLKVGDILREKDINEWRKIGENYNSDGIWKKSHNTFIGDRKINSFKLINGVVGFEVSGTLKVYLRADGYLDFIKNKTMEKDYSSLEITKEEDYSQKTLNLLKKQITII